MLITAKDNIQYTVNNKAFAIFTFSFITLLKNSRTFTLGI